MSQGYDDIYQFLKQRSTLITQIVKPANTVFSFSPTSFCPLTVGVQDYPALHYIQRHTTLGTNPLNKGSVRRRGLYLYNKQHSQEKKKNHATGGIRTRNPSMRAAAGPRLGTLLLYIYFILLKREFKNQNTLCVTACGITHPRCCRPVAGNIVGALYQNL